MDCATNWHGLIGGIFIGMALVCSVVFCYLFVPLYVKAKTK